MEVILRQNVDKIGKAGAVVRVKDGFARNFLIPNGLAAVVTAANLTKLEQEKQRRQQQLQRVKEQAEALKNRLQNLSLTLPVLIQEEDKLYGSITSRNIAEALKKEEGLEISQDAILLEEPLKSVGIFEVPIKLHPEVSTKIKVWIVKK